MQINVWSSDLLEGLTNHKKEYVAEDSGDLSELNLGLSLGGCFGEEPTMEKRRLARSYTVDNPMVKRVDDMAVGSALERMDSRMESQSMRPVVSKRKRCEEQRNCCSSRVVKDGEILEEDKLGEEERVTEGQMAQGMTNYNEESIRASIRSLTYRSDHKVIASPPTEIADRLGKPAKENVKSSLRKPKIEKGVRETGMKVMEEMPCVCTKGNGPNGRKIEGFLYKYGKAEEVRIVCLCHGSFLSPAEFVRHGGGGEVEQPLRHIVVNPSTFFL